MRRPRLSPVAAALAAACLAAGAPPAGAAGARDAQGSTATAAAAKTAAAKKKRTTAQRVTALSRSLNRAKAQQRAAQKQLDAVVKQQTAIGDTLSKAISPLGAINLAAPGGLLAALQDPSTGVPGYLDGIKTAAVDSLKQLLASQEYAVIAVTIGDSGVYVSPTPLISGDISDIGAPVTVSGTVPIAVPGGLGSERLDVRIGAVSLENEKGGVADPPFYANLNHLSVTPAGFTGDVGDARLTGGMAGVNSSASPSRPGQACTAGSAGCGAPVWSGANPDFLGLPYWPVTEKLVSFDGTQFGIRFDTTRMTPLTGGGKLAALGGGSTGPIRVSTDLAAGLAILKVDVSVTLLDPSVNPADPFA